MSKCLKCGKIINGTGRKYCSQECYWKDRIGRKYNGIVLTCEYCGKKFEVQQSWKGRKFCSPECYWKSKKGKSWGNHTERMKILMRKKMSGENSPCWKGGKTVRLGYILIKKPNHPYCDVRGYIYEHRLVMEKHLGRYLEPNEQIHHKNGIRDDNRIENLELKLGSHGNKFTVRCPKCDFEFLINKGR